MERTAALDELRRENGGTLPLSVPWGGHRAVYWFDEGFNALVAFCAECAERVLTGEFGDMAFVAYESGDAYEHDLPCGHCGCQLASHYDPS